MPILNPSLNLWLRRHQEKLWWLHSLYALLLGIGMMFLGARNFTFLRVGVFYIAFIWLSSLLLPKVLAFRSLPSAWPARLQLSVNFFNKNLYQQMLFFVLPIYYASATPGSLNIVFVSLVGLSAVLSTIDVVYDRHLSAKRVLTAGFFAFNLFALINVMLPILWSISNTTTTRIAGLLALIGFLTLGHHAAFSLARRILLAFGAAGVCFVFVEFGRPLIPPVPLHLARVEFGTEFDRESLQIVAPVTQLSAAHSIQLYGMSAIQAPLGLREKVRHCWYENGKAVYVSSLYDMVGGRAEGFRLWTRSTFAGIAPGDFVRLDLETEGGQLIGRAMLRAPK